jgi:hypothetical protein
VRFPDQTAPYAFRSQSLNKFPDLSRFNKKNFFAERREVVDREFIRRIGKDCALAQNGKIRL